MAHYTPPTLKYWTGRPAEELLYIYQKIECVDLNIPFPIDKNKKAIALLGYCCDEGVRRNQGRSGAKEGPTAIRMSLAVFADHLNTDVQLLDCGDVVCQDQNLEHAHELITLNVKKLLDQGCFPLLMGGGHDLAYAHFQGVGNHLKAKKERAKIGVVNLDAHFDLRRAVEQRNSGTPFYQIGQEETEFHYLCLGIQPHANNKQLYETAKNLGVVFLEMDQFQITNMVTISQHISDFLSTIDHIYLTIDLDGFSSAFAPGVSAPSPMGFEPAVAQKVIELLSQSGKLISADVVELNPSYDGDNQTAKLAAWLMNIICLLQYNSEID